VEIAPQAGVLSVDEAVVRRLLCHLLSNAFKFTHDGGVTVAIRPGDEAGSVVIVVRDTGIGIPPERVDEMFELFQQADASTTRQHNGLGMGLTLVQRCVRLLAGDVSVESEPGRGSEFRVRIPDALAVQQRHDDRNDEPRLMH
jgi:signal transduction histidine kinase